MILFSIDAELVDDGLEVRPAVKGHVSVRHLVTAHPAHSADISFSALLLVIGDRNRCDVGLQNSLQSDVALDVFFQFSLDVHLGDRLAFLFGVVLEYASEGELSSVQFIDRVLRICNLLDCPLPELINVVKFCLAHDHGGRAPDFALDPVLDVLDRIGLSHAH